jgi:peptidoglycan/xylan/chitin deacetylase (PgdA/CDA1 family)
VSRAAALAVAGTAAGAAYSAAWVGAPHVGAIARLLGVPRRLPHQRGIAVTFDDGPHPDGTPAILEALAAAGARATFFLVGEQVERWPRVAAAIPRAGHEVALHGYRHRLLLRRSPRAVERDLERAFAVIAGATGSEPTVYRPPYGVLSAAGLRAARERGWRPLLWSRWGRDWEARATPDTIAARAAAGLEPGDVVLLHDADHYSSAGSWRRTAAALPLLLAAVGRSGVPAVSVTHST